MTLFHSLSTKRNRTEGRWTQKRDREADGKEGKEAGIGTKETIEWAISAYLPPFQPGETRMTVE